MLDTSKIHIIPNEPIYLSHHYCDYIEILALLSDEDGLSTDDIYDRFYESGEIQEVGTEGSAELNDKWISRINDLYSEILTRVQTYADSYPFQLDGNRIKKKDAADSNMLFYIVLLLCSSLRYISNRSVFTSSFEYISYLVMQAYLPQSAEVHIFGVSSGQQTRYSGSLEDKITNLANDLGENIKQRTNIFRQGDNGDGGADIVAWLPYHRDCNRSRKLLLLGQSASGNNWQAKQASVGRLENFIDFTCSPLNVLFVPFDFRDVNREFASNSNITAGIVFDRFRIIELVNADAFFTGISHNTLRSAIIELFHSSDDIV